MSEIDLIEDVPERYLVRSIYDVIGYSAALTGEFPVGPVETIEASTAMAALTGLVFAANRARNAAAWAQSWRDYRVGATAAMVNFETGAIGYMDGHNVKPGPDSEINLHAEQIAVAKGRRNGLNRLIGIAVYADPDNDDANPQHYATLRPCKRCIGMLDLAPEADERTLVLGTNPDLSICELYTFGRLLYEQPTGFSIGPFSLKSDADLDHYDRAIQPYLLAPITKLYLR